MTSGSRLSSATASASSPASGAHDLGVRERAAALERDVGVGPHVGALGGAQAGLAAHDDLGRSLAVERLDLLRADGRLGRDGRRPRRDERDERDGEPAR